MDRGYTGASKNSFVFAMKIYLKIKYTLMITFIFIIFYYSLMVYICEKYVTFL